jgi:hypothetical protein
MSSLNKKRGISLSINTEEASGARSPVVNSSSTIKIQKHIWVKDPKTREKKRLTVHMDEESKQIYLNATPAERRLMLKSLDNFIQGGIGNKKTPTDKYYTKPFVVDFCFKIIKKYLKIKSDDLVIEPSAGAGAWIEYIKRLTSNYELLDIKPDHPEVKKQNFLTYQGELKNIQPYIIGNPPFGRKSSTAIKFIKHSAFLNAKAIAFILPNSFKKPSFRKSFPLQYHLLVEKNIPENGYIYKGKTYNVKSIFQIWVHKPYHRVKPKRYYTNDSYKFVKKAESDIAIRRAGFGVGSVKQTSVEDNTNTNWFIKINQKTDLDNLIIKLNKIKFNKKQNTGALSISKQEIIKKYNTII